MNVHVLHIRDNPGKHFSVGRIWEIEMQDIEAYGYDCKSLVGKGRGVDTGRHMGREISDESLLRVWMEANTRLDSTSSASSLPSRDSSFMGSRLVSMSILGLYSGRLSIPMVALKLV